VFYSPWFFLFSLYAIHLGFILDPGLFLVVSVIIFAHHPQREKTGMTAGVGLWLGLLKHDVFIASF
jgi:hypothetical protein